MPNFPLQIVLDLAERQAESQSRQVRLAYVAWLNARTQIVRLQQRRQRDVHTLGAVLQHGCSSAVAQQAAVAAYAWQTELIAAQEIEHHAKLDWQLRLQGWQKENKRVKALTLLASRHQKMQEQLEAKRERRLHDELAQRSAQTMPGLWGGNTRLLFTGQEEKNASLVT